MKKEFKKHIDFKNLNYETVEVERLDDLVKEGVIPEDFTTKFPYLRERKPHSHHTAIMATYYGEGIECVQGAFFECLWYSYSINRKMDKTGRWRYFDLTNCMFGVKNKTFETDNGEIYPLMFDVDETITLEEFQELVNKSKNAIKEVLT